MHPRISPQSRTELLLALRLRYQQATKQEKATILDEFAAVAGCHRKHAIRLLSGRAIASCARPPGWTAEPTTRPCGKPSSSCGM
jgi:hypothetical protein